MKVSRAFAVVTLMALGACKADYGVDLYASDIFASANVATPAVMHAEIPSCSSDKRNNYENDLLSTFNSWSEAKVVGCTKRGLNDFLEISFKAEIADKTSKFDVILFRGDMEPKEINGVKYESKVLKAFLHPEYLDRVNQMLKKKHQKLTYNDVKIEVVLNNDEKSDILLSTRNAWVDGKPYELYARKPLGRREKAIIKLPNIFSDFLLSGEQPFVGIIYRPL